MPATDELNNVHTRCDVACEILRNTDDGDDLVPPDLKLVELAVNGHLTEIGMQAFMELHRKVMEGTYKRPFLHDIEHLTIKHSGYVFWKGIEIEHYNIRWAYSDEAREKAVELARRCQHLEN